MGAAEGKVKNAETAVQNEVANWTGDAAHDIDDYSKEQSHSNDGIGIAKGMYIMSCCERLISL